MCDELTLVRMNWPVHVFSFILFPYFFYHDYDRQG